MSSSGSRGLFWNPLWVFSLLSPCTYSSEVGILSWFSPFADSVACALQHLEELRVCPSLPCLAVRQGWAAGGLPVQLAGSGSSLDVTGMVLRDLSGVLGGAIAVGHVPACLCPPHLLEVPPAQTCLDFCRLVK